MGKAKKLRSTSHKKKVPPTGGATQAEIEAFNEQQLVGLDPDQAELFRGLTDVQGSIREATCVALAGMFGDVQDEQEEKKAKAKLAKMVDAGLLTKLIPCMVDQMRMVRLHAIGALRNISVTGGIDVCEFMTSQNVITPLISVIIQHGVQKTFQDNDLHAILLLEQSIALLTNLCESCQAAINELTQGNLLEPIMVIAKLAKEQASLHLETLRLLLLITESNPRLNEVFGLNANYQAIIGEIIDNTQHVSLYIKMHAVGIAMNVEAIMQVDAHVRKLVSAVEAALAFDAVKAIQMAQQASNDWKTAQRSLLEETEDDLENDGFTEEDQKKITTAQINCRLWKDSVQLITLALELVADLCCGGDDMKDEDEWASDDEDAMEEYANSHMETEDSRSIGGSSSSARAISSSDVVAKVMVIFQGVVAIPAFTNRVIAGDFEKIRIRVCNALNNLFQSLPRENLSDECFVQVFQNLCSLYSNVHEAQATQPFTFDHVSSTNHIETSITAAMFALLRRSNAEHVEVSISADHANLILQKAFKSPSVEARVNTIGMLGCVGRNTSNTAEQDQLLGQCFVSALTDTSLEVVAEALNTIFDLYGDEDPQKNTVFKSLGMLRHLESTLTVMKVKLRVEAKQMERDVVAHIKETQLNLARFIKYKKKHS